MYTKQSFSYTFYMQMNINSSPIIIAENIAIAQVKQAID